MGLAQETWIVRKKDGQEFEIRTMVGLGPAQALQNAGMMWADVDFIRPSDIHVVSDIAAWRRGEA